MPDEPAFGIPFNFLELVTIDLNIVRARVLGHRAAHGKRPQHCKGCDEGQKSCEYPEQHGL